jgi:hypothetical protein
MPLIMNESMVGREWGQNLAKKLIDKINTKKGINLHRHQK